MTSNFAITFVDKCNLPYQIRRCNLDDRMQTILKTLDQYLIFQKKKNWILHVKFYEMNRRVQPTLPEGLMRFKYISSSLSDWHFSHCFRNNKLPSFMSFWNIWRSIMEIFINQILINTKIFKHMCIYACAVCMFVSAFLFLFFIYSCIFYIL